MFPSLFLQPSSRTGRSYLQDAAHFMRSPGLNQPRDLARGKGPCYYCLIPGKQHQNESRSSFHLISTSIMSLIFESLPGLSMWLLLAGPWQYSSLRYTSKAKDLVCKRWDTIKLCMDGRVRLYSVCLRLSLLAAGFPEPQAILPLSDIGCLCLLLFCSVSYFSCFHTACC